MSCANHSIQHWWVYGYQDAKAGQVTLEYALADQWQLQHSPGRTAAYKEGWAAFHAGLPCITLP